MGEILDIQTVLSELLKEIPFMRQEIERLNKENAELRLKVLQLEETIALLKGCKNSRSSSTAPSHDLGRSNQISLRQSSGKKSGGQAGHSGHTLSMSEHPDEIIDHFPDVCQHCGHSLESISGDSYIRRQVIDIPPVKVMCIEHRSHIKTCPCCQFENHGIFPEQVKAPVQYGSNIEAMSGYLSVYQSMPYARITHLFRDFFKLQLSEGSIDNFLERL